MPEAEDVIVDAARHATVFVQELWRRNRGDQPREAVDLPSLLQRLDLLISGACGASYSLRLAQPPALPSMLGRMFRRERLPIVRDAVPATDGASIWLPVPARDANAVDAASNLQLMALRQAARAARGAADTLHRATHPLERALYEVLEASAADADLVSRFRGLAVRLSQSRRDALTRRPALHTFPNEQRPLETWVRTLMQSDPASIEHAATSAQSLERASVLAREMLAAARGNALAAGHLYRDQWIGELRASGRAPAGPANQAADPSDQHAEHARVRSARMSRRPKVREADERDDPASQGTWMVQTTQPHEHAEDPFGAQRPTDRDEQAAAEEFADSLSELAEARLVNVPGTPKEILLADDPPEVSERSRREEQAMLEHIVTYPEWDYRTRSYREPGAAVHLLDAPQGPREWVARTLDEHRALMQDVRRQFGSLRAQRTRLRQQPEGDELDLEACVDARADARAGASLRPGLYQCIRTTRRELAVLLLIDVSGSTDGWISNRRRVIDVEREALLLVCLALQSLGEPYSVQAFSGESAAHVTVRSVKRFSEHYGNETGLRIAGLEPERYTRAGAAIRHASALLMREPARHRLLLMLSDGKPNDMDRYDGRYGVEDTRQAIVEARLQGIFPFCLTIDRHSAGYLPAVFGEHQYAVLHRPELLPMALLGWLRRLVHS